MMFCYSFLVWHPDLLGGWYVFTAKYIRTKWNHGLQMSFLAIRCCLYLCSLCLVWRFHCLLSYIAVSSEYVSSGQYSFLRDYPLGNEFSAHKRYMKTLFCKIVSQLLAKCVSMPARSSTDTLHVCFVVSTLNFVRCCYSRKEVPLLWFCISVKLLTSRCTKFFAFLYWLRSFRAILY